jgi:hypothetical protein
MRIFQDETSRVFDGATVHVDRVRVSASVRIADNGINVTLYANNINMMFYMMRNMVANSYHQVTGPMSISAYNSQISNLPMYSIRLSPTSLQPVTMLQGTIRTPLDALAANVNDAINDKVKFVLYLFILQQWESNRVNNTAGNRIEFAREVLAPKASLIQSGRLLPVNLTDSFTIRSVRITTQVENRPGRVEPQFPMVNLFDNAFNGGETLFDADTPLTTALVDEDMVT